MVQRVQVLLDEEEVAVVERLAGVEVRPVSAMLRVLVREALAARRGAVESVSSGVLPAPSVVMVGPGGSSRGPAADAVVVDEPVVAGLQVQPPASDEAFVRERVGTPAQQVKAAGPPPPDWSTPHGFVQSAKGSAGECRCSKRRSHPIHTVRPPS